MRIVVTNCVSMNGGDAAILEGMGEILRRSFGDSLDISVHDDHPVDAAARVPFQVRPQLQSLAGRTRSRWSLRRRLGTSDGRELLDRYASADLIISTGGTYLTDNYDVGRRIREFELASTLRRPLILFTQSIGPLSRPETQRALRRGLADARLVLLRDERSRAELQNARVHGPQTAVAADAAFALADPAVLAAAALPRAPVERPEVAISVRAWSHFGNDDGAVRLERYLEAIARLVAHLVERRGARVTFISTCQGEPSYPHDDSVVADAIAARLPGSVLAEVRVDRDPHRPRELIERLGAFDLVVATRMHAAILALAGGALVLPIAYEPKMTDLATQLELGHVLHEMASVSARELCASADLLLADPDGLRAPLFAAVAEQRRSALDSGELVREALER
ncbi:MAG TPA: polysaccharide pyruvyl transferase family protein [Thermoleophilaceae bacterium]|jgi:colanic acid/amylovoran biosynthesis protein|nr:polysaccharide pyruvyl transferase family protein [Thermoleophilaceae bacterium]